MQITYLIIIAIITYVLGAVNKIFWESLPNKYIPIQNVLIGFISGLICFIFKIEPNFITSMVVCLSATMSAGGIADLVNVKNEE